MTTALDAARSCLDRALATGMTQVSNMDLQNYVAGVTGQTREVIHGTLGTLSEFIASSEFESTTYDLLNADLMGYVSGTLDTDIRRINKLRNVKTMVLTISGLKYFRNTGEWVEQARAKYLSDDPTREWILDAMPNYRLTGERFYTRDKGSKPMRMFILQLEAGDAILRRKSTARP